MKRLLGIQYKYSGEPQNGQKHTIDYIKPGRVIIAQMLIGFIVLFYRIVKAYN